MHIIPRRIPGSKTPLSDNLTVSFLIDRSITFEVGRPVMIVLSAEEVLALYIYLEHHKGKFQKGEGHEKN